MGLNVGQTFIQGRDAEMSRALLDAAAALGLDPVTAVRTTSHGYVVPDAVADALSSPAPADQY